MAKSLMDIAKEKLETIRELRQSYDRELYLNAKRGGELIKQLDVIIKEMDEIKNVLNKERKKNLPVDIGESPQNISDYLSKY